MNKQLHKQVNKLYAKSAFFGVFFDFFRIVVFASKSTKKPRFRRLKMVVIWAVFLYLRHCKALFGYYV